MTGKCYYLTTLGDWKCHAARFAQSHFIAADPSVPQSDAAPILALVEADEGVHLELEQDPAFQALPHALSSRSVPYAIAAKLAAHGVAHGATTLDVAEAVAKSHPLLRHRLF